jgi:hypothetical protein
MRSLLLLIFITLFLSCTGQTLIVRNADTILEYQIKKRLPLNNRQKEKLSTDIDIFLNNEKKIVAEILPVIDQIDIGRPDEIDTHFKKLIGFFRRMSNDFSHIMARYMVQLDSNQQKEFFANMEEENLKYKTKTQRARREGVEDKMENLLGDLNKEQKAIMKSYDPYYEKISEIKLQRRIELHNGFKEILNRSQSASEKEEALVSAFEINQDKNLSDDKTLEIIKKIIPTLDKSQKSTFREKVIEMKDLLRYFVQANY